MNVCGATKAASNARGDLTSRARPAQGTTSYKTSPANKSARWPRNKAALVVSGALRGAMCAVIRATARSAAQITS